MASPPPPQLSLILLPSRFTHVWPCSKRGVNVTPTYPLDKKTLKFGIGSVHCTHFFFFKLAWKTENHKAWVTKSQHFQSCPSILLATLKRNTSNPASKVSRPGARITRPGMSHPAFRDKLTTAMPRRPVPTPRRASQKNSASRRKTRPRSANLAPRPCLSVLYQSTGVEP
ncbi:hypothetical protein PIB30_091912 [Stylosanthes scabra]|uniref:Uncharacterized protein n=1 Tax=Stylosanthes scabra TaxID=79078 RepID=A0ABU6XWH8_9FABA|nr:hypothetical protein [Stylosanthes scabra]